jgi:hypothetical protein
MKRDAYLINSSRGELVDEDALIEALQRGRIAGAGLDVYNHEPAIDPRFLAIPNVVLLPSGQRHFRRTRSVGRKGHRQYPDILGRPPPARSGA